MQLMATTASSCFAIPAHQPPCQHQPHPGSYIPLCHNFYPVIPSRYISGENINKNVVPRYPGYQHLTAASYEPWQGHPAWPAATLPTILMLHAPSNPKLSMRRMILLLTRHLPKLTPLLSGTEHDSGSPGQCLPAE